MVGRASVGVTLERIVRGRISGTRSDRNRQALQRREETALRISGGTWQLGLVGTQTEKFRSVRLSAAELASLVIYQAGPSYNADGALLRLGIQGTPSESHSKFDPYFSLSISQSEPPNLHFCALTTPIVPISWVPVGSFPGIPSLSGFSPSFGHIRHRRFKGSKSPRRRALKAHSAPKVTGGLRPGRHQQTPPQLLRRTGILTASEQESAGLAGCFSRCAGRSAAVLQERREGK